MVKRFADFFFNEHYAQVRYPIMFDINSYKVCPQNGPHIL